MTFIEQILIAALVFIPMERFFALHRGRKFLRDDLLLDLTHVFATGTLIKLGLTSILMVAIPLSGQLVPQAWQESAASQPMALQFLEILLIADLGFYLAHRAFHHFPFLWRFHVVHHSIEQMDWIAAHRVHPVDQIVTKGVSLVPVFAIGFDSSAILAYAMFSQWQSLLIHSNIRVNFGPLRWLLASPQFHHWHHANDSDAYDKNFAGQLPLWDVLFRSAYMPRGRMPERYGTDDSVPTTYLGQMAHPFQPAEYRWQGRKTLEG